MRSGVVVVVVCVVSATVCGLSLQHNHNNKHNNNKQDQQLGLQILGDIERNIVSGSDPTNSMLALEALSSAQQEKPDRDLWTFGDGRNGNLGHGSTEIIVMPRRVHKLDYTVIMSASCGAEHMVVNSDSNNTYMWGRGKNGQLSDSNIDIMLLPKWSVSLRKTKVIKVFAGGWTSFALNDKKELLSWGWAKYGTLGREAKENLKPGKVAAPLIGKKILDVSVGLVHVLVVTDDGAIFGFGGNTNGQVGVGDKKNYQVPKPIKTLESEKIVKVAAGCEHSLAVTEEGDVWAWGMGHMGQLGTGDWESTTAPIRVSAVRDMGNAVGVAAGCHHSIVILENNLLLAWGWNKWGQLGVGDTYNRPTPRLVGLFRGRVKIKQVAAGHAHSLVLSDKSQVFCFGRNHNGQCARLAPNYIKSPVPVFFFENLGARSICANSDYSAVLTDSLWANGNTPEGFEEEEEESYDRRHRHVSNKAMQTLLEADMYAEEYAVEHNPKIPEFEKPEAKYNARVMVARSHGVSLDSLMPSGSNAELGSATPFLEQQQQQQQQQQEQFEQEETQQQQQQQQQPKDLEAMRLVRKEEESGLGPKEEQVRTPDVEIQHFVQAQQEGGGEEGENSGQTSAEDNDNKPLTSDIDNNNKQEENDQTTEEPKQTPAEGADPNQVTSHLPTLDELKKLGPIVDSIEGEVEEPPPPEAQTLEPDEPKAFKSPLTWFRITTHPSRGCGNVSKTTIHRSPRGNPMCFPTSPMTSIKITPNPNKAGFLQVTTYPTSSCSGDLGMFFVVSCGEDCIPHSVGGSQVSYWDIVCAFPEEQQRTNKTEHTDGVEDFFTKSKNLVREQKAGILPMRNCDPADESSCHSTELDKLWDTVSSKIKKLNNNNGNSGSIYNPPPTPTQKLDRAVNVSLFDEKRTVLKDFGTLEEKEGDEEQSSGGRMLFDLFEHKETKLDAHGIEQRRISLTKPPQGNDMTGMGPGGYIDHDYVRSPNYGDPPKNMHPDDIYPRPNPFETSIKPPVVVQAISLEEGTGKDDEDDFDEFFSL